jgi:hypothetical protein
MEKIYIIMLVDISFMEIDVMDHIFLMLFTLMVTLGINSKDIYLNILTFQKKNII